MELKILEFIYLDFLLDPRFPKNFSETSDDNAIHSALLEYFDQALDLKGFNFRKTSLSTPRPTLYLKIKEEIVKSVFDELISHENVFQMESHPLFGKKCTVNSHLFVNILKDRKKIIKVSSTAYLEDEIKIWGVDRFKNGVRTLYHGIGGFFDPEKWLEFEDYSFSKSSDVVEIPASDRIVQLDHNSPQVVAIVEQANTLLKQLQTGNDIGDLTQDEASAAATEVKQLITAFEGSRSRVSQLIQMSRTTLTWIASKGADALVGVIATALLGMIAAFLGISL